MSKEKHMSTTERLSRTPLIITSLGGLLLGVLIGAGVAGSGTQAAGAPEPAPTETVEVEVPGGTPEACLTALDEAEAVIATAGEVVNLTRGLLSDVFPAAVMAAYEHDAAGIDQATADLEKFNSDVNALTRKVESIDYVTAAAECRG
jgi:hypothetical protein